MAHSIDAYTAIQRMDVAAVIRCAQQGDYDDDTRMADYQEGNFGYRLPALALAICWANNPIAPPDAFAGVLNALVARRGVGLLSAPLDLWVGRERITITPLTLLLSRLVAVQSVEPREIIERVGHALRALLEAGADATAPKLWHQTNNNGEPPSSAADNTPPQNTSLLTLVMRLYSPNVLPPILLPLLQHGARHRSGIDPPNLWRGPPLAPRHPWDRLTLIGFVCAYADRPGLVQYVRDCGENLLAYFVEDGPWRGEATPAVARARIRTLCDAYGFEITDALLARAAARAEAEERQEPATRIIWQALEAERGDRRVEAIQLQHALVSRRGLPLEIAHAILRAPGVHLPALGAAEWITAHPPAPRRHTSDGAARATRTEGARAV